MSYYGPDPKRAFIENLNDILDVQTDTVLDREILAYESYNSRWIPRQLELQDLNDVNYVNPVDNDMLIYNSSTGQFEVGQFTTDNISEGSTNLYYTDARVAAYLASSSYATDTDVSTAIANLIDSAPGTMDTLNELAAALNDDPNFSTTITTLIGTKLNTADFGNSFDVAFSGKTSDNLPEGSINRYFTNTRFNTAFDTRLATAIQSTDNIAEGQNNLYFSNERVDDRVAALLTAGTNITITYDDANGVLTIDSTDTEDDLSNNTTDDLAEGQTNLYYTDARADARAATVANNQILNTVTKSFVDSLGINANYLDNLDSTQFIRKDQDVTLTKQITFPSATSVRPVMPAGFLSRSDTLIGTAVIWSPSEQYHPTNGTTADQYGIMFNYTAGNPSLNIPTETKLRFIGGGNDKFVIDLDGTVTYDTYEVATLNDIGTNLDLSNKSTTDLAEGNNLYYTDERVDDRVAALFNAGTNLSATYDDANNTYSINVDNTGGFNLANNTTSDLAEGTNKYYTDSRADARVTAGFSNKSTDQLSEGSTNLYYTEERAQDAAASLFTNGTHTNITVTYDDVNNKINLSATDTEDNLSNNTTNDLAEGSDNSIGESSPGAGDGTNNLYFTNARADARADARIALVTGANLDLSQKTSDDLPEGTIHRYYRTSRFNTDFSGKTTDDLSEGNGNLYFTTERAQDAIGSLINSGTNISITYDDPNNQLTINVDSTGGLDLSNNDTGDLPEGTNLYYTDTRVQTYLDGNRTYGEITTTKLTLDDVVVEDTTATTTTTTIYGIDSFDAATYRSGKYIIQTTDTVSGEYQVSELLIVHDGVTASVVSYGITYTGTAPLASFDGGVINGNVTLLTNSASANSTVYKMYRTLIEV